MRRRFARLRVPATGLLGRFTLLSALAVAAMGVVLAGILKEQVHERALDNAAQQADLIARFGFQPQLTGTDLSRPLPVEAVDALDALLRAGYASDEVVGINIVSPDGRVVYSSHAELIGRTVTEEREAMGGRHLTEVKTGPDGRRFVDADVPLRLSGDETIGGTLEAQLDYAPTAARIASDTRRLYLVLGIGLLALWAAMYRIAAGASRALRRQSDHNAHQARHDSLTGLPNRHAFYEAVEEAVAAAAGDGPNAAVLIIDLDRFKEVNDTLGHHAGDALLRQAAERLRAALRGSDLLARLGGDEFAVLVPSVESAEQATQVAERVRAALEATFDVHDISVHVGASVGIALAPDHGRSAEDLLQRADVAMYQAKEVSSSHEVYEPSADPYCASKLSLVAELRDALDQRQLEIHYQPKASLASGDVDGVEALVRWNHPERGLIPPNDFIPLAEHTGLIDRLTVYVMDEALRQCAEWGDLGLDLAVAINLSARNIADSGLPETVADRLAAHGVDPSRLVLELTESTLMVDPKGSKEVLARLHEMGVGLAIDDFGTGYSSLSYLSELPVTELKIDRSFVMSMATSDGDAFIVRATIDLGRNLGLRVVAEGVETEAVWNRLAELGCDVGQGYYLSRPVPATELTRWLISTRAGGGFPASVAPVGVTSSR